MAKRREELFLKNGSLLLEKLVCSFNGKSNPIRYFSDKELQKATNNYSSALDLHYSGSYKCYKGSVDDQLICVRKFDPNYRYPFEGPLERIINEIAIATQMSAHKNVLKLLGCCLETQLPTLVYEFPMDGSLSHLSPNPNRRIQSQPLLLKSRLRIAWEIANVAAYLHTAFPRPFIHRDIRLANFFLDQDCAPKLFNFFFCIPIPEGETHATDEVMGITGNIAPESLKTGKFTEKNDVFSFGTLLLELLTGQRGYDLSQDETALLLNCGDGGVDPTIPIEGEGILEQQVYKLFLRCSSLTAEERPTMVDVSKELRQILSLTPDTA